MSAQLRSDGSPWRCTHHEWRNLQFGKWFPDPQIGEYRHVSRECRKCERRDSIVQVRPLRPTVGCR